MKNTKMIFAMLLFFLLLLTGCNKQVEGPTLNNVTLADYAIVYSENAPVYNQRAAEYI